MMSGKCLKTILAALKEALPNLDFVVECTDFSRRHKEDFRYVSAQLGVQPVILCASDLAACYRRRAYWASFKVEEIEGVEVDPNSVLAFHYYCWFAAGKNDTAKPPALTKLSCDGVYS